jgi:glutamate dehydrogenase/leucine dehydrogenase
MASDVTTAECFALARAMTLKNAMAGLRHGGAKAVIVADPAMPVDAKERLMRAFGAAIADVRQYIPGPDMGTDEMCMAWTRDEIGRAVGLPAEIGGIPLDEIGATGFGLAAAIDVAAENLGMELDGARCVVQGFGAVGRHTARFLAERGCRLVGASDSRGAIADPDGLDVDALVETKRVGSVADHPTGTPLDRDALVGVDCEIWIPAARPDALRVDNIGELRARIVAQGANVPVTPEAETRLHEGGVVSLPDFVVNAGGVICGAVEYAGGTRAEALRVIDERIRENTAAMLEGARSGGLPLREWAMRTAVARVRAAMRTRRFH